MCVVQYDKTGIRLVKVAELTAFLFTDSVLICDYPEKGNKLIQLHFLTFDDLRMTVLAQDLGKKGERSFMNLHYLVRNGFEISDKGISLFLAATSPQEQTLWLKELGTRIKVP